MKKGVRRMVYDKYGGRCAYCGKEIEYKDMQVDHAEPVERISVYSKEKGKFVYTGKMHHPENDTFENYMPACRSCNHYKHSTNIEGLREMLSGLHERIAKVYTNKVAINYGIITLKPFDGFFYYEKLNCSGRLCSRVPII